ncbi:MAG: PorV/PorQ family protein [Elusimicrobiota bacterium]
MKPANFRKLFFATANLLVCGLGFFVVPSVAGEAGTTSGAFLKFNPSPRATGMGEACTAVTQDAYSAWANPAGLASLEVTELAATHTASFEDVTNQYASFALPVRYGSTFGVSITRQSVAPFQGYDASGDTTRKIDAADMAIAGSYARTFIKDEIDRPVLNVGVSLKSVSERLDTATADTLALDLGAIYHIRPAKYWMSKIPAQEFRVGLSVKNLGGSLKFDRLAFPLPQSETLGLAWISHPAGAHTLTVSLDQTVSNDDKYKVNLGAEYFMFQLLSLRAGYVSGQSIGTGLRVGVGFRLSFMDLDYSMSPFGELGMMQKVGVTMRFGSSRAKQPLAGATARVGKAKLMAPKDQIEALKTYAADYVELARKSIDARQYTSAVENLDKAFNLEPQLKAGAWGEKAARLSTLSARLQLKATPARVKTLQNDNEQSNTAHEAVVSYIEGNELKSFLLAHAALGANPRGDAMFEEMLYTIADLTRGTVRRDEIMPKAAMVNEKLKKAAKGFYIQQFDMAAKECEEVVLLDETNPMGWTRLGSAYYMMGDKAKAQKAYEKVMELNPGDTVTRQFMDAQGWK